MGPCLHRGQSTHKKFQFMSWFGSNLVWMVLSLHGGFWRHHPFLPYLLFLHPFLSHLCLPLCTAKPHRISFPSIQEAQVISISSLLPQCFWPTEGTRRSFASARIVTMSVLIWMSDSYMSVVWVVLSFLFEYSCCLLQRPFGFIVTAIQAVERMFSFKCVSMYHLLHSALRQLPAYMFADVYVNVKQLGCIPSFPSFCLLSSIPPSLWSVQTPHNLDLDSQILIPTAPFPLCNYPAYLILLSPDCFSCLQHYEQETHLPL